MSEPERRVQTLQEMLVGEADGHVHTAVLFINGDRITGWTSVDEGHFHVLDFPIGILGETEIDTTPAQRQGGALHAHRIAEAYYP